MPNLKNQGHQFPEHQFLGHELSYRKKICFSFLACCLFFVGLEGLLSMFAVDSSAIQRDPFVGFAGYRPLFEPHATDNDIWLETSVEKRKFFNPQRFAKRKPANTFRIFCLGGSTTFGRPFDDTTSFPGWLRELLPLADTNRHWEVINAGGISYASYRVAELLDELVEYSPDLFIIYTGHNEFLEARSYGEPSAANVGLQSLNQWLQKSRTYVLAQNLLPGTRVDDRWLLPEEVDAILDHSVGPDAYTRDDALRESILQHFEFNLNRIVDTARGAGAGVLLVTPSANVKDFSPFKSEHREDLTAGEQQHWSALVSESAAEAATGNVPQALILLDKAEQIDNRRADLDFRKGTLLHRAGRFEEANRSFRRAIEQDVCPLRAIVEIQQMVEATAVRKGVPLVDFNSILIHDCQQSAGHRSPGNEYFLDHVHPTIAANRLLSLALIEAMTQRGVLSPGPHWGESAIATASRRIENRVDPELQARGLTNLAQVLCWAGKQTEAGPIAIQAVQLRSQQGLRNDPESSFYAAVHLAITGDDERALELFQQVVALQPQNAAARWRLATLLYDQSRYRDAAKQFAEAVRLDPTDAYSHRMRGIALIKTKQYEAALASLRQAAELGPEDEVVRHSISIALEKMGT